MGLFDKFFKSGSKGPNLRDIQGLIVDNYNDSIKLSDIFSEVGTLTVEAVYRDPSKAIDAIHWDGLTPEAQEALSKQGFYRDGDDNVKVIKIEP